MGGESKKTEYGENLEFRNRTREKFDWYSEYEPDGLLEPDHGRQPELVSEFPGLLLEGNITCPVAATDI